MAIDDLLRHLEQEAEESAARIVAEAEREAGEIAERSAGDRDRRRRAALARLDADLASESRRALARVEREARRLVLIARAGVVDRILERAAARLEHLSFDRYRERLPALVAETLVYLEDSPSTILCPQEALRETAELLAGVAGVAITVAADAAAGVIGRSVDGKVTVDDTLVARLHRDRAELAIALTVELDGSPDVAR